MTRGATAATGSTSVPLVSDKIVRMSAQGDCYEAAGNYMMQAALEGDERKLTLVHGEVTGQGPLHGVKFGHAWVEIGGMVIDKSNGRNLKMPKEMYYAIGKIGSNTHRYTMKQFRRKAVQTGVWGPWDLETETGL